MSRLRLLLALGLVMALVALPTTAALPLEPTDHDDHDDHDDTHDVLGEFDDPHGHSHDDVSEADRTNAAATIMENAERWSGFLDELRLNTGNPIATDDATYTAFARVFSDPHGCLLHDGFEPPEGSPVSPYAKGRGCQLDYLTYEEVLEGAKFLEQRFPDLLEVIRLDERYDDPSMTSAGIARPVAFENGTFRLFGRDTSPLYMFKVTNRNSETPEEERLHFTYGLSIHGLERAGLEGGVRAMEDLVTWAACEDDERAEDIPACELEGPFPKEIVESETDPEIFPVPTAGEVLDETVNYFFLPNPDGWRLGQKRSATELRDGGVNANYLPGPSFLRGNGHGVDLNRDWPSIGYTDKSHQPLSEPETRAFHDVFSDIRDRTSAKRFAGGIDLHGMSLASAFSYTLLGADQRDYRKNEITVETSLRTYEDQTQRLRWSPYIGDSTGDGEQDQPAALIPVADEWGTIYDTIGYTVTGALGFWMDDSEIGLGGVGINNEMALSNIVPNTVYEPGLNQTHIDGNKGLIYSQIAALMFEEEVSFEPTGTVGYVHNPVRITDEGTGRPSNPDDLPAQGDIDVFLPCQGELQQQLPGNCGPGTFSFDGSDLTYEFEVLGNDRGVHNGGMTVRSTTPQQGVGAAHLTAGVILERLDDDGEWETMKDLSRTNTTYNDPEPGTWRIRFDPFPDAFPRRVEISFQRDTAEADPGQNPIDASTMDFFTELNEYVPDGQKLQAVDVAAVTAGDLGAYDTLIVTHNLGNRDWLTSEDGLGLSGDEVREYFVALRGFADGGGNLVLTDGALHGLADLELVGEDDVIEDGGLAGFYAFAPDGELTYEDPDTHHLARGVDLPGAAERNLGERQAVEPTPLGYHPSGAAHARMPFWGVDRDAWEDHCGEEPTHCTTATTSSEGTATNLGEIALGDGVVRIAGTLLPDPLRQEDENGDNRFGLASYALTYTSYIVFENLIDWEREREDPEEPTDPGEPVATQLAYIGETTVRGNNDVHLAAELTTEDDTPVADGEVTFLYDGEEYDATTDEHGQASAEARPHSGRDATVTVTFDGDDDHEPSAAEATIRRGQGNGPGTAASASSDGLTAQAAASPGLPGPGTALWLTLGLLAAAATALLLRRRSLGSP